MQKKALIITYYWPPAGGPGVQRWLKFVKYLPDYGIHPIVYIPENPSYPMLDKSLIDEIPENVTIIKQPIKEPYKLATFLSKQSSKTISSGVIPKKKKQSFMQRLMLYVRGNYFIPDARKRWVKPSVSYLSDYIQNENIETVITTGPPHSLHLIGLQLKAQLGIHWIADFRDPWTTIGYHKKLRLTVSAAEKHEQMEKQVLTTADHIIVTSENTKKEFETKSNQPITVITNGYDYQELPKVSKDLKFSLAHIGSLLSERNPKVLWKVLGELINENQDFRQEFVLRLIGVVSDDVLNEIKQFIPKQNMDIVGYVNHTEALKSQRQSQLLLLIEIDSEDTKAIIPGKLFEYMVAGTPIISVGPKDSDVERIIKSTNTGRYFYYDDEAQLKEHLLSRFSDFKNSALASFPIGLQQYSRKALTKKLADLIQALP
ncbi:glycosyltransferase family 4 protein [Gelidibacter pelagius]|uniref:Glycosyltransferase family 4 protein n=1 Tax=Gelidibacter pelagius TaxID=2819985 RepID=A0ABS3SRY2_9FLAO|nr:glycosyltransferase family 4 protein [Gelidibacter pelagius]MBO3098061.1 glycosyltransferase family 4 protein [Gelidibacter pelagius]